jgi:hypothetical protein
MVHLISLTKGVIFFLFVVQGIVLSLATLGQSAVLFHLVVKSLLKLLAPYCRSHATHV